jgi:hypothetical protein
MEKETKAASGDSDIENSIDTVVATPAEDVAPDSGGDVPKGPPNFDFPDGGARSWSVAYGAAGVLFCTFGYANAFGCVPNRIHCNDIALTSQKCLSSLL